MLNMVARFLASKPHAVEGNQVPQNVLELQSKSSAWVESRKSRRGCSVFSHRKMFYSAAFSVTKVTRETLHRIVYHSGLEVLFGG